MTYCFIPLSYVHILVTQKYIILGLVAIAFVAGSSGIGYSFAEPNGTPFLQEEIDAIIEIIEDLQDQLDNIHVAWVNVTDKPAGFADDIDNDTLALLDCSVDQIVKHNGEQWKCSESASKSDKAEIALKKLDCNLIRNLYIEIDDEPYQFDITDGCDLAGIEFEHTNFSGAYLVGADFTDSTMAAVDFTNTNLSGTDFTGAELYDNYFINTNLSGADFTGAELDDGNDFTGAFADPPCTGNDEICNDIPAT
jgi:hypothetical protein